MVSDQDVFALTLWYTSFLLIAFFNEFRPVAFTACTDAIADYGMQKCVPSNYKYYPMDNVYFPTKCSCAA